MAGWSKGLVVAIFLGAALCSFAQEGPKDRILQAVDSTQQTVLRGSAYLFAKPAFDAGRVDGGANIDGVSLVFAPSPEQKAALQELLRDQQDRNSARYHKWLTPGQYASRFGMSAGDLAKVTAWLRSAGFEVNGISRSHTRISFNGTAAQMEAAFHTEIHHYRTGGEIRLANATELSVPAAFAGTVLGVSRLGDLRTKPGNVSAPGKQRAGISPHYTGSSNGDHYLAPADFATIYDLSPLYTAGYDGTGQTIAIMGQTEIYTADIDAFRTAAGLTARTSTNFQTVLVPNTGTAAISSANLTEADLDLEWAEAVAPNVNLLFVYVGNDANANAFTALEYTIDQNLAPVISITYGICEANLESEENITAVALQAEVQQANAQGQTVIAASGDQGAADCDGEVASAVDGLAVDVPAAIPEVTGVGGTEFTDDASSTATTTYWNAANTSVGGSAISYIPEIAWDDTVENGFLTGTGGGVSTVFTKPTWQVGTNVPADGYRDVPDIAFSASSDHDAYLVCSNQTANDSCMNGFAAPSGSVLSTGGTSFGAPTFAGIVALINQRTGSAQGNVNPTLYSLAESTAAAFHDITTGSNDVPCTTGSPDCPANNVMGYVAGTGYDQTTGLGSIDANVLVNAWPIDYSLLTSPTSVSIAVPGGTITSAITLSSIYSFTGTVTLACTPQSGVTGLTCSIRPSTVTAASPDATLTIATVGSGSASLVEPASHIGWLAGSGATLVAGFFLIPAASLRRGRIGLPLFLLFALLAVGAGCGGASSSSSTTTPPSSTPPGNYTVKITGTSGTVSFATSVAIEVQ